MTTRSKNIILWSLTGLVGLIFIGSAMSKFLGGAEIIQMASETGIAHETFRLLGILELLSVLLFIFPRTGVLGTLLLASYMGGAITTHLTLGQSVIAPLLIEFLVCGVGVFRFPEFRTRLLQTGN
ncbi:MAG: DoxX family protein [Flavobacteriales bacterium]|nr:DoxX family protein [Flavobacteriales bacterium]